MSLQIIFDIIVVLFMLIIFADSISISKKFSTTYRILSRHTRHLEAIYELFIDKEEKRNEEEIDEL